MLVVLALSGWETAFNSKGVGDNGTKRWGFGGSFCKEREEEPEMDGGRGRRRRACCRAQPVREVKSDLAQTPVCLRASLTAQRSNMKEIGNLWLKMLLLLRKLVVKLRINA